MDKSANVLYEKAERSRVHGERQEMLAPWLSCLPLRRAVAEAMSRRRLTLAPAVTPVQASQDVAAGQSKKGGVVSFDCAQRLP